MVPSSWICMVLSSSAQASSHHAVHRRMTSTGWLRLLSTTEAMTVSTRVVAGNCQCLLTTSEHNSIPAAANV